MKLALPFLDPESYVHALAREVKDVDFLLFKEG